MNRTRIISLITQITQVFDPKADVGATGIAQENLSEWGLRDRGRRKKLYTASGFCGKFFRVRGAKPGATLE